MRSHQFVIEPSRLSHQLMVVLVITLSVLLLSTITCEAAPNQNLPANPDPSTHSLLSSFSGQQAPPSPSSDPLGTLFNAANRPNLTDKFLSNVPSDVSTAIRSQADPKSTNQSTSVLLNVLQSANSSAAAVIPIVTTTNKPTFLTRLKTGSAKAGERIGTFFKDIPNAVGSICLKRCECGCEHNRCKTCPTEIVKNEVNKLINNFGTTNTSHVKPT